MKLHTMLKKVNDHEDGYTWGKDVINGFNGLLVGINASAKLSGDWHWTFPVS